MIFVLFLLEQDFYFQIIGDTNNGYTNGTYNIKKNPQIEYKTVETDCSYLWYKLLNLENSWWSYLFQLSNLLDRLLFWKKIFFLPSLLECIVKYFPSVV